MSSYSAILKNPSTLRRLAKISCAFALACVGSVLLASGIADHWPKHWPHLGDALGVTTLYTTWLFGILGFLCGFAVWISTDEQRVGYTSFILAMIGMVANGIFVVLAWMFYGMSHSAWH